MFNGRPLRRGELDIVVCLAAGSATCSGVRIDDRRLLTAAHGVTYRGGWFIVRSSDATLPRARLLATHMGVDLALLELETRWPVGSIALPVAGVVVEGMRLLAAGFGARSPEQTYGTWRASVGTSRVARASSSRFVVVRDPVVACYGDSGGPALTVDQGMLLGIVQGYEHHGERCGDPIRYTRIDTDDVLTWLSRGGGSG